MRIILTLILLTISMSGICQNQPTDTSTTAEKLTGKWVGQKTEQFSDSNNLETYPNVDTLILNNDFNYKWTVNYREIVYGTWGMMNSTDSSAVGKKLTLQPQNTQTQDQMNIYKLSNDTLILRFFDCNRKNLVHDYVDMFYIKSKWWPVDFMKLKKFRFRLIPISAQSHQAERGITRCKSNLLKRSLRDIFSFAFAANVPKWTTQK